MTMTAKNITRVPALGQAWLGDWRSRILDRLRARGFETVTDFSESKPKASLLELAEELSTDHDAGIDHADVAGEQLVRIWRDEVKRGGKAAVERFSRRMLVGELHQDLPGGWRADWTATDAETKAAVSRMTAATTHWTCNLSKEDQPAADRVFEAMLDEGRAGRIPPGWLPASADDPILVEIFRKHWREPG